MAEMNIKQIIDRLNAEFTGDTRKLVFWYDDNGEFLEDMQNVELENAKVYFLQPDNQFATKLFSGTAGHHNKLPHLRALPKAGCAGQPSGGHATLLQAFLC